MKTCFLTVFLSLMTLSLFSQNWEILNANKTYFYRHSDSLHIGNTIHIDSLVLNENTESFFTSYKYKECDTCTVYPDWYDETNSIMIYRFAPEFLGFEIVLDNNSDQYEIDNNTLKHHSEVGENWDFSSLIQASTISVGQQEIFGEMDSIKTIVLSSNDTIMLSKNKGLIRYPDFENVGKYYELRGYHEGSSSYGEYAPNFWSTYDFEVGDSYCLHSSFGDETSWGANLRDYQFKVLENLSGNTLIGYKVQLLKRHTTQGEFWEYIYSYENYIDTLTINYSDYSIENFFGVGEGMSSSENSTLYNSPFSNPLVGYYTMDEFNVLPLSRIHYDENYGVVKTIMSFRPFGDSLLYKFANTRHTVFANNFGRILDIDNGFEWQYDENLQGAVISGDTIGDFCNFPIDLGIEYLSINTLSIHPNPAQSIINIEGSYKSISIYSQTGQLVMKIEEPTNLIDVEELSSGIYLIKAYSEEKLYTTKLFIE